MRLLQTERLRLRPVDLSDVEVLHRIWTDAGVRRYLWDDAVIDVATAESVVRESELSWSERGYGLWLALDGLSLEPVGFVGFRATERSTAPELLFGFMPGVWNQGLATEASAAALHFLFSNTAATNVQAETDRPNVASIRVLEKLGMVRAGEETVDGRPTVQFSLEPNAFDRGRIR